MISVRLDWTLEEFYASDGITSFADRMAAVLGVHASQVKVVAVYKGSVIVEMFVESPEDEGDPEKYLSEVQLNFYEAVASGTLELGAPIMDAMADGRVVKTGYKGDHDDKGKNGNIWDHLTDNRTNVDDNENKGQKGSTSDQTQKK